MHTHVIIKGSVLEDAHQAILSRCIWMMWIYLKMVPSPVFHGSLSFGHSLVLWCYLHASSAHVCSTQQLVERQRTAHFFFCLVLFKHHFCFSALSRSIQEPNNGIVWKGMNEVILTVKTQYSIDGCAPELLVYLFDREWNIFSKGPNLYNRLCLQNPKTRKGSETKSEKRSGKEIEEKWGKKGTEKRRKTKEERRKESDEHDLKHPKTLPSQHPLSPHRAEINFKDFPMAAIGHLGLRHQLGHVSQHLSLGLCQVPLLPLGGGREETLPLLPETLEIKEE